MQTRKHSEHALGFASARQGDRQLDRLSCELRQPGRGCVHVYGWAVFKCLICSDILCMCLFIATHEAEMRIQPEPRTEVHSCSGEETDRHFWKLRGELMAAGFLKISRCP